MKKLKEIIKKPSSTALGSKRVPEQALRSRLLDANSVSQNIPFKIQMDPSIWPVYDMEDSTDDLIKAAGKLLIDITDNPRTHWARGESVDPRLAKRLFTGETPHDSNIVPRRLLDLTTNKVVLTEGMKSQPEWAFISHVWGDVTETLDGRDYGVDWQIPIGSPENLEHILEAARVVVGERYVWMDILCLDQRSAEELNEVNNEDAIEVEVDDEDEEDKDSQDTFRSQTEAEEEIRKMRFYLQNAVGCFVWLDNPNDDPAWEEVLHSIQVLNRFFCMDRHGAVLPEGIDRLMRHEPVYDRFIADHEAALWMNLLSTLEKAPWFKRVWTLQEAVVPENVWFCTPERYMTGGAQMCILSALLEAASKRLVDSGSLHGAELAHLLQGSEIHKTVKLRFLDRRGLISFWHLIQATASRRCKLEHDKLFGVSGLVDSMVRGVNPNYSHSLENHYAWLYMAYTFTGNFDTMLFVGGPLTTRPKLGESMPYFPPRAISRYDKAMFNTIKDADYMVLHDPYDHFGWDRISTLTPIQGCGALEEWGGKSCQIMNLSLEIQREIARAFELDDAKFVPRRGSKSSVCPGAIAAAIALTLDSPDQPMAKLQPDLRARVKPLLPTAMMQWLKILHVVQRGGPCALVAVNGRRSGAKLALIEERPAGSYVAIMPGFYRSTPGPGFILARIRDEKAVIKVGVGLGRRMTPSESKERFEMWPM